MASPLEAQDGQHQGQALRREQRGVSLAWLALLGAIAFLATILILPLQPSMPAPGLDPGWVMGMNQATAMRLSFGTEFVFSFGPYAFLYTTLYHPALTGLHLFAASILMMAYVLALATLSGQARQPLLAAAAGVLLTWLLLLFTMRDVICLAFPVLYLFVACTPWPDTRRHDRLRVAALLFLAVSLALLTLTKGSLAIASVLALSAGVLASLPRGRRWRGVLPALAYALALPAFWVLAGQDIAALPAFFRGTQEIARGYTEAMQLSARNWHLVLFLAVAATILAGNAHRFRLALPSLALFLGVAAVLFLAFKAGFVRHDGHAVIAAEMLGVIAFAFVIIEPLRWQPWCALVVALAGGGAIVDSVAPNMKDYALARARGVIPDSMAAAIDRVRHPDRIDARYEAALARIRAGHPLPEITGTADIYSFGQSALLAHGITWSPRPVFQSYSAYTARLAAMNAAHLLGPRAPETVLLTIEPIDGRLASTDDGASWPILLSHYAPRALFQNTAVLQRLPADQVRPVVMTPIASRDIAFGETVPLPPDPTWLSVTVRPTLLGRLTNILFKSPMLRIMVQFPDGREETRRLIPDASSAGFLISPAVENAADFIALSVPSSRFRRLGRPVSFRILGRAGRSTTLFWQDRIAIELQAVTLPAQAPGATASSPVPVMVRSAPRPEPVPPDSPRQDPVWSGSCSLDLVNGTPVSPDMLRLDDYVEFDGWAALERPRRHGADRVTLLLSRDDGATFRVPTVPTNRHDVAAHFGESSLENSGYKARFNMQGLPGVYDLSLELTSAQGVETCRLVAGPLRVGDP